MICPDRIPHPEHRNRRYQWIKVAHALWNGNLPRRGGSRSCAGLGSRAGIGFACRFRRGGGRGFTSHDFRHPRHLHSLLNFNRFHYLNNPRHLHIYDYWGLPKYHDPKHNGSDRAQPPLRHSPGPRRRVSNMNRRGGPHRGSGRRHWDGDGRFLARRLNPCSALKVPCQGARRAVSFSRLLGHRPLDHGLQPGG